MGTRVSAKRSIDYSETTYNTVTQNYTLQLSGAGTIIALSGQSLTSPLLSVIVPNNDFPQGYQMTFVRIGFGPVTFAAYSGVNLRASTNSYTLAYPYSIASLVYTGDPIVGWLLYGDLA